MDHPLHLTCPHCDAVNRISESGLDQSPNCGSCHRPLFTAAPLALTDANAERVLGRTDLPLVIDCYADWCGPCQQFAPVFAQGAREFEPRIRFAKLDTEINPQTAARFQIRSIPTLLLFGGGKELARHSGAMSYGQFSEWLYRQLQD